ncbi:MAG TPA: calcium-binding protein, partial [Allosphingosinicella sp.]|nr:calcium-binding protein [Allosphingosinicella sp.]
NDLYVIDDADDVATELANEGVDEIRTYLASYTLGGLFENLSGNPFSNAPESGQTLTGNGLDNVITGSVGNDRLNGEGGNDLLDGWIGADAMSGGAGNDFYHVDDGGDTAVEAAGEGFDRVFARISWTLAANSHVEMLTTHDNLGTASIGLTGNALSQYLYGNAGSNQLDGGGGGDVMSGFGGNDFFIVRNASDRVVELAGEGNDRVFAAVSFALEAGSHVEMLTTIDNLATTAINLTGNALSQYIYGNAGVNLIDGGGGGDVMTGFEGDDFYVVRHGADRAVEAAGGGNDRVFAVVDFTLEAGSHVELLTMIDNLATTPISLTGNALAQYLYGNAGSNQLDGRGGGDVMTGFEGGDFYVIRAFGDRAVEAVGGGTDRVFAAVSFTSEVGSEVELLTMIDNLATTAIDLTGNEFAQYLYGNAGANILDGRGAADVMTGFGGADGFAFTSTLGGGNVDRIADFVAADDTIRLDDAVFAGLAPGVLAANAFVIGTQAADSDDRIIYNQATGALLFDADGNAGGAAVHFATLDGVPFLAASDFLVI